MLTGDCPIVGITWNVIAFVIIGRSLGLHSNVLVRHLPYIGGYASHLAGKTDGNSTSPSPSDYPTAKDPPRPPVSQFLVSSRTNLLRFSSLSSHLFVFQN